MAAKDTDKPKKQRFAQIRQLKQVYDMAREVDPSIPWWMLGAFVGVVVLFVLIGIPFGMPVYLGFIGVLFGILAATFILSKRAEKAAYSRIEGQPGATAGLLQGLRRGTWAYDQTPVAVEGGRTANMAEAAMVFRTVGLPGVVLIAEGPAARAERLLAAESKKVARLAPNVPVTTFRIGEGGGDHVITARELTKRLQKLPKSLTKEEVRAVNKRLKSISGVRPPVPQGIDPNRIRQMGRGPRR